MNRELRLNGLYDALYCGKGADIKIVISLIDCDHSSGHLFVNQSFGMSYVFCSQELHYKVT